ncbi:MAG: GAF domain-containing sensor histidine kinase [Acidobacteria bacterium]|nr:GAF domain-containing sensor histidine kinase [Acidobacteriota bacterium]
MAQPGTTRRSASANLPRLPFDVVDIRSELGTRPRHRPRPEREHRAFKVLAAEMGVHPRNMLQKLAELALDLCDAHTAGISLLEGDVFRWAAVAGVHASARGGTTPRDQSPSGVCIDRDATQLMHLADRCFPTLLSEPRFVEVLMVPFHAGGKPIGSVWVASHTADRQFDKEDERVVRELASFASAGWQLLQASEALDESSRRKDAFLAMLGHELRNPLEVILTAASLLKRRATPDEGVTREVDVIARQAGHLKRLADDLLDVARVVSGKLRLERETVDLRLVVADALGSTRRQIELRDQSLTVELGDTPILLSADPARLTQLVVNLVDNAAKVTPNGGHISVAVSCADDNIEVVVRDTGVGISSESAQGIFEPFVQGETSSNSRTGLGLDSRW